MPILPKESIDRGTTIAILLRAAHRRIPRLERIKAQVDRGERLTDWQIAYLNKIFNDAHETAPYITHHPELNNIVVKVVSLYHEITEQALKNEEGILARKAPRIDLPDL